MTNNSSVNPYYFQFTVFTDHGALGYLFFILCLLFYVTIIFANVVIIVIVCQEKSLHQPMYMFVCCLSVNALYGSAGFFPRFLMDILSDTHLISHSYCFIQSYVIYMYVSCELIILSIMAYDRYVAICQPLHYHSKMTSKKVVSLMLFVVIYPAFSCGISISIIARLTYCGYKLNRIFCSNWPVMQLSCTGTLVNNDTGQTLLIIIFIPLFYVLYTYLRILLVCRRSSPEFRGKALQTLLPHTLSFLIFSFSLFCELSLSRYDTGQLNPFIAVGLSLAYVVIPPITNPLLYGLKLPQIRALIIFRSGSCIQMLKVNMQIVSK